MTDLINLLEALADDDPTALRGLEDFLKAAADDGRAEKILSLFRPRSLYLADHPTAGFGEWAAYPPVLDAPGGRETVALRVGRSLRDAGLLADPGDNRPVFVREYLVTPAGLRHEGWSRARVTLTGPDAFEVLVTENHGGE